MQKRSVLFINDSLWNSSGVFRALLPILQIIDYTKYDVTLYISADARIEADALAKLPKELHLILGKDDTHLYRNVFVFTLFLLSFADRLLSSKNRREKRFVEKNTDVRPEHILRMKNIIS